MTKQSKGPASLKWLLAIALFLIIAIIPQSLLAQEDVPQQIAVNERVITLQELGEEDIALANSTEAVDEVRFRLPNDWLPGEESFLELVLNYTSVNSNLPEVADGFTFLPGNLYVTLNGIGLGTIDLNNLPPDGVVQLTIPTSAWQQVLPGQEHTLRFQTLSGGGSCGDQFEVVIRSNSAFNLILQDFTVPGFDLSEYPQAILSDTLLETEILFVLPDEPSATDLASASSIAIYLGENGQNSSVVHAKTASDFSPALDADKHLIAIGAFESNSLIEELISPETDALSANEGLIEIVPSPFNPNRAALVVTGSDEESVTLSATALSRKVQRPLLTGSQVIVTDIMEPPSTMEQTGARTLQSLGYLDETRRGDQVETITYLFDLPEGYRVAEGGFINLRFAHAEPLNDSASLSVYLNDLPIAATALNPTNSSDGQLSVTIPEGIDLWRTDNELSIRAEMPVGSSDCRPPLSDRFPWVTVFKTSTLAITGIPGTMREMDLGDFPRPFIGHDEPGTVEFVLPDTPSVEALTTFVQISADLATFTDDENATPAVSLGTSDEPSPYQIVIGTPSSNSYLASLNDRLLQPFDPETNTLDQTRNSVQYDVRPGQTLGVIQLLVPKTSEDSVALIVTGTDETGVSWAGRALSDYLELRDLVEGNLAFVEDVQISSMTVGSTVQNIVQIEPTPDTSSVEEEPAVEETEPEVEPNPTPATTLPEEESVSSEDDTASRLDSFLSSLTAPPLLIGGIVGILIVAGVLVMVILNRRT